MSDIEESSTGREQDVDTLLFGSPNFPTEEQFASGDDLQFDGASSGVLEVASDTVTHLASRVVHGHSQGQRTGLDGPQTRLLGPERRVTNAGGDVQEPMCSRRESQSNPVLSSSLGSWQQPQPVEGLNPNADDSAGESEGPPVSQGSNAGRVSYSVSNGSNVGAGGNEAVANSGAGTSRDWPPSLLAAVQGVTFGGVEPTAVNSGTGTLVARDPRGTLGTELPGTSHAHPPAPLRGQPTPLEGRPAPESLQQRFLPQNMPSFDSPHLSSFLSSSSPSNDSASTSPPSPPSAGEVAQPPGRAHETQDAAATSSSQRPPAQTSWQLPLTHPQPPAEAAAPTLVVGPHVPPHHPDESDQSGSDFSSSRSGSTSGLEALRAVPTQDGLHAYLAAVSAVDRSWPSAPMPPSSAVETGRGADHVESDIDPVTPIAASEGLLGDTPLSIQRGFLLLAQANAELSRFGATGAAGPGRGPAGLAGEALPAMPAVVVAAGVGGSGIHLSGASTPSSAHSAALAAAGDAPPSGSSSLRSLRIQSPDTPLASPLHSLGSSGRGPRPSSAVRLGHDAPSPNDGASPQWAAPGDLPSVEPNAQDQADLSLGPAPVTTPSAGRQPSAASQRGGRGERRRPSAGHSPAYPSETRGHTGSLAAVSPSSDPPVVPSHPVLDTTSEDGGSPSPGCNIGMVPDYHEGVQPGEGGLDLPRPPAMAADQPSRGDHFGHSTHAEGTGGSHFRVAATGFRAPPGPPPGAPVQTPVASRPPAAHPPPPPPGSRGDRPSEEMQSAGAVDWGRSTAHEMAPTQRTPSHTATSRLLAPQGYPSVASTHSISTATSSIITSLLSSSSGRSPVAGHEDSYDGGLAPAQSPMRSGAAMHLTPQHSLPSASSWQYAGAAPTTSQGAGQPDGETHSAARLSDRSAPGLRTPRGVQYPQVDDDSVAYPARLPHGGPPFFPPAGGFPARPLGPLGYYPVPLEFIQEARDLLVQRLRADCERTEDYHDPSQPQNPGSVLHSPSPSVVPLAGAGRLSRAELAEAWQRGAEVTAALFPALPADDSLPASQPEAEVVVEASLGRAASPPPQTPTAPAGLSVPRAEPEENRSQEEVPPIGSAPLPPTWRMMQPAPDTDLHLRSGRPPPGPASSCASTPTAASAPDPAGPEPFGPPHGPRGHGVAAGPPVPSSSGRTTSALAVADAVLAAAGPAGAAAGRVACRGSSTDLPAAPLQPPAFPHPATAGLPPPSPVPAAPAVGDPRAQEDLAAAGPVPPTGPPAPAPARPGWPLTPSPPPASAPAAAPKLGEIGPAPTPAAAAASSSSSSSSSAAVAAPPPPPPGGGPPLGADTSGAERHAAAFNGGSAQPAAAGLRDLLRQLMELKANPALLGLDAAAADAPAGTPSAAPPLPTPAPPFPSAVRPAAGPSNSSSASASASSGSYGKSRAEPVGRPPASAADQSQSLLSDLGSTATTASSVPTSPRTIAVDLRDAVEQQQQLVQALRHQQGVQAELTRRVEENVRLLRTKEETIAKLQHKLEKAAERENKRRVRAEKVFEKFAHRPPQPAATRGGGGSADTKDRRVLDMVEYLQGQLDARDAQIAELQRETQQLRGQLREQAQRLEASTPHQQELHEPWVTLLREKTGELEAERLQLARLQGLQLQTSARLAQLTAAHAAAAQEVGLLRAELQGRPQAQEVLELRRQMTALLEELQRTRAASGPAAGPGVPPAPPLTATQTPPTAPSPGPAPAPPPAAPHVTSGVAPKGPAAAPRGPASRRPPPPNHPVVAALQKIRGARGRSVSPSTRLLMQLDRRRFAEDQAQAHVPASQADALLAAGEPILTASPPAGSWFSGPRDRFTAEVCRRLENMESCLTGQPAAVTARNALQVLDVWAAALAHYVELYDMEGSLIAHLQKRHPLALATSPSAAHGPSPPPAAIAHAVEELVQREADLLNSCFPHSRRAAPPWPSPLPTTSPAPAPGGPQPQPIAPAAPPPTPSPVLTPNVVPAPAAPPRPPATPAAAAPPSPATSTHSSVRHRVEELEAQQRALQAAVLRSALGPPPAPPPRWWPAGGGADPPPLQPPPLAQRAQLQGLLVELEAVLHTLV